VITLLVLALVFAKFVKGKAQELGEGATVLYEELSNAESQVNLPSVQAMQAARDFLEEGNYSKAREKLLFIVNFYSDVPFAKDARRILGAMNMDHLMNPSSPKYKESYQIKSGDSLSKIAKRYDTTVENIMAVNGLKYSNRIQPGQEIKIVRMDFRILVDVQKKIITVFKGDQFLNEYPILDTLISSRKKVITTSIDRILGFNRTSTYQRGSSKYYSSQKMIILRVGDLQIRPVKHPDESDPGAGFFINKNDMEEIALFMKSGTQVEIQL